MEDMSRAKAIIESLLIVSGDGLRSEEIIEVLDDVESGKIKECIALLNEDYQRDGRAFTIAELAGRYRIVTRPEYMPWIKKLYQTGPERLSGPSLETLAIIAYKQPATRAEIEFVRGVNVGGVLKTLLEKGLIKVRGRKDIIGKPLLYGTTEKFMEFFGLNTLDDLPMLRDFREEDLEYVQPREPEVVDNEKEESDEKHVSGSEDAPETSEIKDDDVVQEGAEANDNLEDGLDPDETKRQVVQNEEESDQA